MNLADDKEFLRVKIDLPSFQFEVVTRDTKATLQELRRIMESVRLDDQAIYEEFVVQEMRASLSEQFVSNSQVMAAVKRLLKQEDDYRVAFVQMDVESGPGKFAVENRLGRQNHVRRRWAFSNVLSPSWWVR